MTDILAVDGDAENEELFNHYRGKVFAAARESIERFTVPLVVDDGTHLVEQRSGVLLQIADMHFLVTAGHAMVDHHVQGRRVGIALPVRGSRPVLLVEEEFWTTKDDQEDISVTRLTRGVVEYIKDHYRYVRLTSVMSRNHQSQGKGMYLIFGFPRALLGQDDTGCRKMESWKYLTVPYRGDYVQVKDYDPKLHLVLNYERDSCNQEGERVYPHGMSGCGIWFAGTPHTHSPFRADDVKLVAIQNCWHKGLEYAKGTWIDDVLLILWKYYPETRKPMMLAGFNFFANAPWQPRKSGNPLSDNA